MTPNEQRIAITELCGWKRFLTQSGRVFLAKPTAETVAYWRDTKYIAATATAEDLAGDILLPGDCPDYLNSLDAMHEAEDLLDAASIDVKSKYWDYLAIVTMPHDLGDDTFLRDYAMLRATAAQRSEAFLRTMGKWKE